jgi:hypothetical protein
MCRARVLTGYWGRRLQSEAKDMTIEDLCLSSIHPCACEEEDETESFMIEGYIFGVQQDLKGL